MFFHCDNITSVTLPENVTIIKDYAFAYCPITSLLLPSTLTSIGECAFTAAQTPSISIPASVTDIGRMAFYSGVQQLFFNSESAPSIGEKPFYESQNLQIYVPCNALENYQNDEDWAQYKDYLKTASHKFFISSSNKNYGTVSVVTENSCDDEFTLVLTATPTYDNYQFGGWSDGNKENPRTITVTKDTSFTALFGEKPQINNLQQVNPICTSATGSISFEVTNGVAPYTILWNDGITDNPRNNMTLA